MMLFGLYRLRRHGGLMALGRLLWNQVSRWRSFFPTTIPSINVVCSVREGVVWILIVVVAELTPTVSRFIFLPLWPPHLRSSPFPL
jgi:hypothetical protein